MALRETRYGVNASIFGDENNLAAVGIDSRYGGVLSLVNPNGDEHYIYPTFVTSQYQLSAGNRTLMIAGTEGTNLVAAPITTGPILDRRAPGLTIFGSDDRISQLLCVGARGFRGGVGFTVGAAEQPSFLYFTDVHVPQLGSFANWQAGTGGTALGAALAGPFSKYDESRPGMTNLTGPLVIAGLANKKSGLGLALGGVVNVVVVWTNGTALSAGSPADWKAAA